MSSLRLRGVFNSAVTDKAVCLPGDLSQESLGLDTSTLEVLRSNLTVVIHSAWMVNFNVSLGSFERSHIAGVHNMIKLCLRVPFHEPARLFFVSSISAAAGTPIPATILETHIEDLHYAQNMGYARSKLVAEHILRAAAKNTGMHARVLRTGQLMGDAQNGLWNATEAIPLMIQSATTIGALPMLDEVSLHYITASKFTLTQSSIDSFMAASGQMCLGNSRTLRSQPLQQRRAIERLRRSLSRT